MISSAMESIRSNYGSLWAWEGKYNLLWWCENIEKKPISCPPANSLFNVHNGPIKSAEICWKISQPQMKN